MTTTITTPALRVPRGRRIAYAAVAGILGALLATAGTMLAVGTFFTPPEWFPHRVHDLALVPFVALLVAGGVLAQVKAPERQVASYQQLAAVLVAALIAATLGDAVDPTPLVVAVLLVVLWALHPAKRTLPRLGSEPSVPLAAYSVLGGIPFVLYGLAQTTLERTGGPDDVHAGHWVGMATLAFAIPLVGLVAAGKAPGWRVTAALAALASVLLGAMSLAYPALPSSLGTVWGSAAVLGGIGFLGLAVWEARRCRAGDA